MAKASSGRYVARSIEVLEGLEPVRKRPAMYIGSTDKHGLHHLIWEIVDNCIDEVMNGHGNWIQVQLAADGKTATVVDNGRGIPVDVHPRFKKSALELILTQLHAGAKFGGEQYMHSGGLHGVGASVVNALSESMVATVRRDGKTYRQEFKRGVPRSKVKKLKEKSRGTGTEITFTADSEIFGKHLFDPKLIQSRLEAITFLHAGLRITFRDDKTGEYQDYKHDGGMRDFLGKIIADQGKRPTHSTVFQCEKQEEMHLNVALQWTDATDAQIRSYANGVYNPSGGTHETGLKNGIVRAMRTYMGAHGKQPKGVQIAAEDIREGLVAVLSVFLANPQYQGQTKERLNNAEVGPWVEGVVRLEVEQFLSEHPTTADQVIERIILAARARAASRQAAKAVQRKSPGSRRGGLPGKLADCSLSDPRKCELFIVEGDSAGGNARQGRDRRTQAILPLRGKVLNAEQATMNKVLENQQLQDLVKAMGCGIGKDFDVSRIRYGKICLLMDADVDGHHISTLLLAFFYRYLPGLVREGLVYVCQPPLYKLTRGKEVYYAADEGEREKVTRGWKSSGKKFDIQRFKGLGEMNPKTLFETTLDPRKRVLYKVVVDDDRTTDETVSALMGKDAAPRFEFIMESAGQIDADALDP